MKTPAEIRALLVERDGPTCQWPGCEVSEKLTIHHKIPRALGGSAAIENLCLLCEYHHDTLHRFLKIPDFTQRRLLRPGYPEALQAMRAALQPAAGGEA